MKNKKIHKNENYLDRVALHRPDLEWTKGDDGLVTLNQINSGLVNKIAQKLFKKPPVSYIHLDSYGSFLWLLLDGEKNAEELGVLLKEKYGEEAEPLYPRLVKFLNTLESYNFIIWAEK